MTQYKDTTQPTNTLQRATSEQNNYAARIGEMIQISVISGFIIFVLLAVAYCQPVNAQAYPQDTPKIPPRYPQDTPKIPPKHWNV